MLVPQVDKTTLTYIANHGYGFRAAPRGKTPDPLDAKDVFLTGAIEGPPKPPKDADWYGVGANDDMYRFSVGNGQVHFNGKTGPPGTVRIRKEDIPAEVKKALGWKPPPGR
jgi:hypothetical protein